MQIFQVGIGLAVLFTLLVLGRQEKSASLETVPGSLIVVRFDFLKVAVSHLKLFLDLNGNYTLQNVHFNHHKCESDSRRLFSSHAGLHVVSLYFSRHLSKLFI